MNRLVSGEASSAKGPRDTLRAVGQRHASVASAPRRPCREQGLRTLERLLAHPATARRGRGTE